MIRFALAALMSAAPIAADAQVTFQSPKAGSLAPGVVVMCLDNNGLAVPQSNGACPVSGLPQPTVPATGAPTDAAVTQQSISGMTVIGTRAAEPNSLGLWFVQNQSAASVYLVFYAADGVTRIGTIAVDPGAGQGRQGGSASYQDFGPFKGPMTLYGAAGAQATMTRQ